MAMIYKTSLIYGQRHFLKIKKRKHHSFTIYAVRVN